MAQSFYLDRSAAHLFKRCVQCPNESPSCPNCASDEVCTTTIGDCYSCASAKCVKTALSGSTNASNSLGASGPNVPAIAGGVAAGIVAIIVVAWCIWKYGLNGKRTKLPPEAYWDEDLPEEKPMSTKFGQLRDARSSTHTVASLASTVLTRASNVIQIAYIPGVTQRDNHLAPPVPPVPIPTNGQPSHYSVDQRFFVPQLRDSQWSDNTSIMSGDIRKSVASSLARSSIGTMIYQDNAVANPMPAMPVRGVNVISVKSASSTSTTPMDSPASQQNEFGMAHKASVASSAASRPVIVKMLGGSDASRARAINGGGMPAVGTAKAMKPISLNILKKGHTTPSQSSIDAGSAGSPATTLVNTPDRLTMRPRTANQDPNARISIADSIDTTAPHARARLSIAHSHRTIGDESSDEDEDDGHQRSRQSLLAREQGPFSDDAAVHTPTKEEKRRSPFGDDNAL